MEKIDLTAAAPTCDGNLRAKPDAPVPAKLPVRISRYRVEKLLGRGGFGVVYLAHDEQLQRAVAIKVPHVSQVGSREHADPYLAEAQTVANLEHPHIVPVYDVGSTPEFPFFVVSKYVPGTDLATKLKESRVSCLQAAELVAAVAEALHYAHKKGLVHRDVKPGNILIDAEGKPYLVDFGLALREENVGKGPTYAGTPNYMSPEQARGEGHRVDGRSDIFSLGIVFYELLVGRRPFLADSQLELLQQITVQEPRPPRQWDDAIPRELERICIKALSKRPSERYSTAQDLTGDLRLYLAQISHLALTPPPEAPLSGSKGAEETVAFASTSSARSTAGTAAVKIVPKGLRSFDAHDADFFLELLPGPRDRDGLPDSLRFWKTRIEETDPDETFGVGLIYGPSGCGKSSLVKAGLLPRLAGRVIPVYVEATPEETETRLLHGLRKRCPGLSTERDLKATLSALRRGEDGISGTKVLVVLDQFEQWLHARRDEENTELVQALRQCDGGRVQAIVMVRDDFWMAATRLMRELEIRLAEGHNSAAADLFTPRHAEKVLAAFGRAFGALPESSREITKDQKLFLEQAVQGLAQEGKVVCVRLALFAEMMKGRPWTTAALKEVGGTEGIGVTFLEETFSTATAPPQHRYHQKAARAVLTSLLPESGSDIKGNMRSHASLLEASGYSTHRRDFDELIRILDSEMRLITPTYPEGGDSDAISGTACEPRSKYYQLTHDYLVVSLREWLTRKQKETRRGRAELRLADRAALWNAKPENRLLPSAWDFFNIRLFSDKSHWSPPQRTMMRRAGRVHWTRCGLVASCLLLLTLAGVVVSRRIEENRRGDYAASLVRQLLAADITQVPTIVQKLHDNRGPADRLLRQEEAAAPPGSNQKMHLALALLPVDPGQAHYLGDQLPSASPAQFRVLRDALLPYRETLGESLWKLALDAKRTVQPRFQAACALATYSPEDARWKSLSAFVAGRLVKLDASALVDWRETLRPAKQPLIEPLARLYRDRRQPEQSRIYATETLAEFAADRPDVLFDLLADAEPFQFQALFDRLAAHKDRAVALAEDQLGQEPPLAAGEDEQERLAKRQANAAITLFRMGQAGRVWRLLKFQPDPRARSYLVHWLSPLGADPLAIIGRLGAEPDVTIRRALVLALGEFSEAQFSLDQRGPFVERLATLYEHEPDAGLHGAVEWLLRKWGRADRVQAVIDKLQSNERQMQARRSRDLRQWYVSTQKHTFVVVDAGEFRMGSLPSEPQRATTEAAHTRRIGRRIAVAAHEVTKAQWAAFERGAHADYILRTATMGLFVRTDDSPQTGVSWYAAAHYCNWLSEQEGIPKDEWCFEPNPGGAYAAGMRPRENYLTLAGYRLPTEAEWEYACRSGTTTSRYYGLSEALLPNYAWYQANGQNRTWPVASLKPNDLGLFDMLGNAWEWCFDVYVDHPQRTAVVSADAVVLQTVEDRTARVLRGGAFDVHPQFVRSACRVDTAPANRDAVIGLRPVRTLR
jgi:serine/threonine protein kinase/formylglycine-generating enzyme required for sulfatase activity